MSQSDIPKLDDLKLEDDYQIYKLGNFALKSGGELQDAFIAYKTLGDPSLPAIIYPTWYSGLISDNLWLTGPDKTLNPKNYYIIIPALFGNGQSTSPSNTTTRPFPPILFYDNIRAQHALLTKHLHITHARAVLGWSMGAGQTYQWATQYPDFMDLIVPFCGAAKTSPHNQVMLEGVKSALYAAIGTSSQGICQPTSLHPAAFTTSPSSMMRSPRDTGLRALGRVYAGWGFSQAFYREHLYRTAPTLAFPTLNAFLELFWEKWALSKDPENMLCMAHTWQAGDCAAQEPYAGDFGAAMRGIRARALVCPSRTDLYFPPEDSEVEVRGMREGVGRLEVFPSIWGHWAGGPGQSTDDVKWLDEKLREFFAEN
ncbi:homoserine acetyltransferase family protein-like protein [Phaeosphaeriaceae sp. PMI808]|nr:homoserine acetyltransferase family protein-like protein [Phaeosphaeriaceae sp. PMI808]